MPYSTYFDLVESLITGSFGGPQDAEQRDIRTAIHKAYSEVTNIRDWAFYHVHGRVITDAPYGTGTVSSSGVTVTLTGGTWPTWAGTGAYLKVGEQIARVASRTSGSVIVLDSGLGLKADVSGVGYTLYRSVYPLPDDFRNMDEPSSEYHWWSGLYVTPDQAMKLQRVNNTSGSPLHWTVIKDPLSSGWAIQLVGYPDKQETIDFTYRRSARQIRYSGHEPNSRAGTIARTGGTVTLSGATTFDSGFVGSILRVGTTANHPGPIESITPWVSESLITAVGSTTQLTTEGTGTVAGSTKYIVTDPVDVAPHMQQALDSCCDYWLSRIRGNKPENAFAMYQRDLRLAMEMDQLAPISGRSDTVWHDGGWRSQLKPDGGT